MELKTYTDQLATIDFKNDKQNGEADVKARILAESHLSSMKTRLDKGTISQQDFDEYFKKVKELMVAQDADISTIDSKFEKAKNDIVREAAKKTKEAMHETFISGTLKKVPYGIFSIQEDLSKNSASQNFCKGAIDEIFSLPEMAEFIFKNPQVLKQIWEGLKNISWEQIKESFPNTSSPYETGRAAVFSILLLTGVGGAIKSAGGVLAKKMAGASLLKGVKKTGAEVAGKEAIKVTEKVVSEATEATAKKAVIKETAGVAESVIDMATSIEKQLTGLASFNKLPPSEIKHIIGSLKIGQFEHAKICMKNAKIPSNANVFKSIDKAIEKAIVKRTSEATTKTTIKGAAETTEIAAKDAAEIAIKELGSANIARKELKEITEGIGTKASKETVAKTVAKDALELARVEGKKVGEDAERVISNRLREAVKKAAELRTLDAKVAVETMRRELSQLGSAKRELLNAIDDAQRLGTPQTKLYVGMARKELNRFIESIGIKTGVKEVGEIVIEGGEEVAKKNMKRGLVDGVKGMPGKMVKGVKEFPGKTVDGIKKTVLSIREAKAALKEAKGAVEKAKDAVKQAEKNLKQAKKLVGNKKVIELAEGILLDAKDTLKGAKDALSVAKNAASIKRRMAGAALDVAKKPLVYGPALATVAAGSMEHKVRVEAAKVLDEVGNDDIPSAPPATPVPVESQETTSPVTPPEGPSGTPVPSPEGGTPEKGESQEESTEPVQSTGKSRKKSSKGTSEPRGKEGAHTPLTPEQIKEGAIGTVATKTGKLHMRNEKGVHTGFLDKGEQVTLTGESKDINNRKYVKVKSSDGKEGFVAADFIKVDKGADKVDVQKEGQKIGKVDQKKQDSIPAKGQKTEQTSPMIGELSAENQEKLKAGKSIEVGTYVITQGKVLGQDWYSDESGIKKTTEQLKKEGTETFSSTFELYKKDGQYILEMNGTGAFKDDIKDMGTTMPTKQEVVNKMEEMRNAKQEDGLKNYAVTTGIYEVSTEIKKDI